MRKIIAVCLMVIMLASLTLSVFSAPGGFIQSPSNNPAPEITEAINESEDCLGQLIITPYIDRDTLPEEDRIIIESIYKQVVENKDLSAIYEELANVAAKLDIDVKDLAVSDLFDIRLINCDIHDYHGRFNIKLKAETLQNFVCLLHYYNGEYHVVKDARVLEDGEHLVFSEKEFSPFLIVTNTGEEDSDAPQTNDMFPIYVTVAAVSGLMLLGLAVAYRKERA
jgi:hypothetical protein